MLKLKPKFVSSSLAIKLINFIFIFTFYFNFSYSQDNQDNQSLIDSEPTALNQKAIESLANLALYKAALIEAELELVNLVDNEQFLDAVPLAERIVFITEEEFGASQELAQALNTLGNIENNAGLYDDSSEHFLQSIDIFRDIEGFYSESAIIPLVGLGIANQEKGNFYDAISIFNEARTLSRRVYGLLNEEQILIMRYISNVMVEMENYDAADEIQLEAFKLMERVHGVDTIAVLPGIYQHADWLRRSYRFDEARILYSRAIAIIEKKEGQNNKGLIKPLVEISNSYRDQKFQEGRGIGSLKKALQIAENQDVRDELILADILIAMGDWYTAFNRIKNTRDEYTQAWQILGNLENAEELRKSRFNDPIYVLRENPTSRGLSEPSDPESESGNVLIMFDVDRFGRTLNLELIESKPEGLKDASSLRAIARSRFRPRIIDGEIVITEKVLRNFSFYYKP